MGVGGAEEEERKFTSGEFGYHQQSLIITTQPTFMHQNHRMASLFAIL